MGAILLIVWLAAMILSHENVARKLAGQTAWTCGMPSQAGVRRTRRERLYVITRVTGAGMATLTVSLALIRLALPRTDLYFDQSPQAMVLLAVPAAVTAAVISYFAPISERVRTLLISK